MSYAIKGTNGTYATNISYGTMEHLGSVVCGWSYGDIDKAALFNSYDQARHAIMEQACFGIEMRTPDIDSLRDFLSRYHVVEVREQTITTRTEVV